MSAFLPVPVPSQFVEGLPILNGNSDIAMTLDGAQMRIQAPGRVPFRRVWLWKYRAVRKVRPSERTGRTYIPSRDGPQPGMLVPSLPSAQELCAIQGTQEYLEVGLIIGRDPSSCTYLDNLIDRDWSALRVFTQVGIDLPSNMSMVVGVALYEGRSMIRYISSSNIFYYPEFRQHARTKSKEWNLKTIHDNIRRYTAVPTWLPNTTAQAGPSQAAGASVTNNAPEDIEHHADADEDAPYTTDEDYNEPPTDLSRRLSRVAFDQPQATVDAFGQGSETFRYVECEPIPEGAADIATTHGGHRMHIQAPDREPYQKVWLWTFEMGKLLRSTEGMDIYNANRDCPIAGTSLPRLPTVQELTRDKETEEYLEVGLVIGRSPHLCMKESLPEIIDRDWSTLRAFTRTTEVESADPEFVVGVRPVSGRPTTQMIDSDSIYFYPEYCQQADIGKSTDRWRFVHNSIRHHAARNTRATYNLTLRPSPQGSPIGVAQGLPTGNIPAPKTVPLRKSPLRPAVGQSINKFSGKAPETSREGSNETAHETVDECPNETEDRANGEGDSKRAGEDGSTMIGPSVKDSRQPVAKEAAVESTEESGAITENLSSPERRFIRTAAALHRELIGSVEALRSPNPPVDVVAQNLSGMRERLEQHLNTGSKSQRGSNKRGRKR